MPGNNDRIIFQHGEDQPISEKEFEQSQTSYEQTEMLKHRLIFWTATAAKELEQYGYYRSDDNNRPRRAIRVLTEEEFEAFDPRNHIEKIIFAEEISEDETIYHYPGVIPQDAKSAERAACHVLKTAMALWEAIFSDNKPLIANLGLEFGLAVASAHALPFEKLAITGKKSTDGYKNRTKSLYIATKSAKSPRKKKLKQSRNYRTIFMRLVKKQSGTGLARFIRNKSREEDPKSQNNLTIRSVLCFSTCSRKGSQTNRTHLNCLVH